MRWITDNNRKWWICGTMTLSLSMILIDQTVVSVALPTIQRELHVSETGLQWIVNAYLLAIAAFVAVGGRIGDMYGNDRVFKLGASVFVAQLGGLRPGRERADPARRPARSRGSAPR